MSGVKGGNYGGVSAAARQSERRRRLLAAALEVIGGQGWAAVTVRAVCAEAGLSSRFFYESFASVEELAVALFDDIFERSTAAVAEAVTASPRDARIRNRVAIETFVRSLTDDRRIGRFALMEALGSEALTRRRLALVHSAVEAVLNQIGPHGPRGVSRYREVVATVLIGGLVELLIGWMHGEIDVDLDQLIDDYVQLVLEVGDATFSKARPSVTASRS
jgi:AcrR family transcriptional regulator